jgi:uncharacterized protein YecE (DUF72 family)
LTKGLFFALLRGLLLEWRYRATPPGFVFAVKGSRYITHLRRLKEIEKPLANFFAQGLFELREKLGPILWQFPPMFRYRRERLAAFFAQLPHSTGEALKLARRRDSRLHGRSRLAIDADRPLRHAIEIRHPSFMNDEFVELLREHDIALVVADTAGKWPRMLQATADFAYARLHGDIRIYTSGYTDAALTGWARRIRKWDREGRDVYVYFDNDVKVKAPYDALALMKKLKLSWGTPVRRAGQKIPRLKYAYGPRVISAGPWLRASERNRSARA